VLRKINYECSWITCTDNIYSGLLSHNSTLFSSKTVSVLSFQTYEGDCSF
jgi:hypothetical protein